MLHWSLYRQQQHPEPPPQTAQDGSGQSEQLHSLPPLSPSPLSHTRPTIIPTWLQLYLLCLHLTKTRAY